MSSARRASTYNRLVVLSGGLTARFHSRLAAQSRHDRWPRERDARYRLTIGSLHLSRTPDVRSSYAFIQVTSSRTYRRTERRLIRAISRAATDSLSLPSEASVRVWLVELPTTEVLVGGQTLSEKQQAVATGATVQGY